MSSKRLSPPPSAPGASAASPVVDRAPDGRDAAAASGAPPTLGRTFAVDAGAVPIVGGAPTVLGTKPIQVFGQGGSDVRSVDQSHGPWPPVHLVGGSGNDVLSGGDRVDLGNLGQVAGTSVADVQIDFGREDCLEADGGIDAATVLDSAGADGIQLVVDGGLGNDTIHGGAGTDLVSGGDGDERVHVSMALDAMESIELRAQRGADAVTIGDMTGTDVRKIQSNPIEIVAVFDNSAAIGLLA
jgi:Ca2+-binding RTX toxin-like protein